MRVFQKALTSVSRCLEAYMKLQTRARPWALKESTGRSALEQPIMVGKKRSQQEEQPALSAISQAWMHKFSHVQSQLPAQGKNLMSLVLGRSQARDCKVSASKYTVSSRKLQFRDLCGGQRGQRASPNHPTEENLPAKLQSNQHSKCSPEGRPKPSTNQDIRNIQNN